MNAAHMHLLVNHLPIVGFAIGLMLVVAALVRRGERELFLAAVLVLGVAGCGALAAQLTGEPAEEVVEHLPDMPKALIETHEGAALIATIFAGVTTALALVIGFVTLRRQGPVAVPPMLILLLASAGTSGVMAWTGSTGGKIRHSEIRGTATPSSRSHSNAAWPGVFVLSIGEERAESSRLGFRL